MDELDRLLRLGVPMERVKALAAERGLSLAETPQTPGEKVDTEPRLAELAALRGVGGVSEDAALVIQQALERPDCTEAEASEAGRVLYQLTKDAKRRGLFRQLEAAEEAADLEAARTVSAALERHGLESLHVVVAGGEVRLSGHVRRDNEAGFDAFVAEVQAVLRRPVKNFAAFVDRAPRRTTYGVTDDEIEEFFDPPEVLERKVRQLAELVRRASAAVAYTGAGISTSAGIPDFRGPQGCWTASDRNLPAPSSITMEAAAPTLTHQLLAALSRRGTLAGVVSQNVDNLHARSGIPRDQLAELHGNSFVEECDECHQRVVRDFDVTCHRGLGVGLCTGRMSMHSTGRLCEAEGCGGTYCDTIINFGENLPVDQLERAQALSEAADLAICMGTSMRVQPACNLPLLVKRPGVVLGGDSACCRPGARPRGGALVIVNLQATPADEQADLVIHARSDDVMRRLSELLAIPPLPFCPSKSFHVTATAKEVRKVGNVSMSESAVAALQRLSARPGPAATSEPQFEVEVVVGGQCGSSLVDFVSRLEVILPRELVHAQPPARGETVHEDSESGASVATTGPEFRVRRWSSQRPEGPVRATVRLHFLERLRHEPLSVPVEIAHEATATAVVSATFSSEAP